MNANAIAMSACTVAEVDSSAHPADLYCGHCGISYADLTIAGLANLAERTGCPACQQYLADLTAE